MDLIRYGSRGTNVQYVQLALYRYGNSNLAIDGIFGAQTQEAVRTFQSQNGLSPDGVVGPKTMEKFMPLLRGYAVHTVRSGDTFYTLSQDYQTDLGGILRANPTKDPDHLQIGDKVFIPYAFPLVPHNVNYSYFLTACIIEGLSVRYPFLKTGSIGKSVMGRPLAYLCIGKGEKEICYNASHHANEWLTTPVLLTFAEEYLEACALNEEFGGKSAKTLFSEYSLYLVPLVNPDGVDLVTGILNAGGYYNYAKHISEQYSNIPFPSGWKANIEGVDLNLQYPAGWEEAKRIKEEQGFYKPAPRDFVGKAPLTTPESIAMYKFTQAKNFRLTLSYHSQGELIYWKYADYEPERSKEIADYFGEVSGYTVALTPYNSSFAGYKDWFIQNYNRPGYTIEIGTGQSPLPLAQFPEIYKKNFGILLGGMTQM